MREAQPADVTTLVELLGVRLHARQRLHRPAFEELLSDARLGRIWIIVVGSGAWVMLLVSVHSPWRRCVRRRLLRAPGASASASGYGRADRGARHLIGSAVLVEVAGDNDPALRPRRLRDDGRRLMVLPVGRCNT